MCFSVVAVLLRKKKDESKANIKMKLKKRWGGMASYNTPPGPDYFDRLPTEIILKIFALGLPRPSARIDWSKVLYKWSNGLAMNKRCRFIADHVFRWEFPMKFELGIQKLDSMRARGNPNPLIIKWPGDIRFHAARAIEVDLFIGKHCENDVEDAVAEVMRWIERLRRVKAVIVNIGTLAEPAFDVMDDFISQTTRSLETSSTERVKKIKMTFVKGYLAEGEAPTHIWPERTPEMWQWWIPVDDDVREDQEFVTPVGSIASELGDEQDQEVKPPARALSLREGEVYYRDRGAGPGARSPSGRRWST